MADELYPFRDAIAAALAMADRNMVRLTEIIGPYELEGRQSELVRSLAHLAAEVDRTRLEVLSRGGSGKSPPA